MSADVIFGLEKQCRFFRFAIKHITPECGLQVFGIGPAGKNMIFKSLSAHDGNA
jgi:hypothetical protein